MFPNGISPKFYERRKPVLRNLLLLSIVAVAVLPTIAQDGEEYTLSDITWITGIWRGEEDGTVIEEIWSGVEGSNLMGMFRFVKGGNPRFYEFMTIGADSAGIGLDIKHFDPDMTGWEERDASERFVLDQVTGWKAVFRHDTEQTTSLVYERREDSLRITLHKVKDGRPVTSGFSFRLQ